MEEIRTIHRIFLHMHAVYTLVFDVQDDDYIAKVQHWLYTIKFYCKDIKSPVILVAMNANNDDISDISKLLTKKLKSIYPYRTVIFLGSEQQSMSEISTVLKNVVQQSNLSPIVHQYWEDVAEEVYQMRISGTRFIHLEEFFALCPCLPDRAVELGEFLHNRGTIVWLNKPDLRSIVILEPLWLVGVFESISQFPAILVNGIIPHSAFSIIWKQYPRQMYPFFLKILNYFGTIFTLEGTFPLFFYSLSLLLRNKKKFCS